MPDERLHTCILCEATCGITLRVEEGRIVGVRGDPEDPFSRGHVCPKAAAIPDVMHDPDRIRARELNKYRCYACPLGCGGICSLDGDGRETHKPEYETVTKMIDAAIFDNNYTMGAVGLIHAGLVARKHGMAEHTDVQSGGKTIDIIPIQFSFPKKSLEGTLNKALDKFDELG